MYKPMEKRLKVKNNYINKINYLKSISSAIKNNYQYQYNCKNIDYSTKKINRIIIPLRKKKLNTCINALSLANNKGSKIVIKFLNNIYENCIKKITKKESMWIISEFYSCNGGNRRFKSKYVAKGSVTRIESRKSHIFIKLIDLYDAKNNITDNMQKNITTNNTVPLSEPDNIKEAKNGK